MSAFDASAGIMIWIGSPESRTRAKTTMDTTNIETIDWITRPTMKRCIAAQRSRNSTGFGNVTRKTQPPSLDAACLPSGGVYR